MNEAIKLAIEKGGYKPANYNSFDNYSPAQKTQAIVKIKFKERVLLDPLFWQALGKALGWGRSWKVYVCLEHSKGDEYWSFPKFCMECGKPLVEREHQPKIWKKKALEFFELKLFGGDEEKFFEDLLNKQSI